MKKGILFIIATSFLFACGEKLAEAKKSEDELYVEEMLEALANAEEEDMTNSDVEEIKDGFDEFKENIYHQLEILEEEKFELHYRSEYDTIVVYSLHDYFSMNPADYSPLHEEEMFHGYYMGAQNAAQKTALEYLGKSPEKNFFNMEMGVHIYNQFNVLDYGRMGKNAAYYGKKYFGEFYDVSQCQIDDENCACEDSTWVSAFKVVGMKDYTHNGVADLLVSHHERAKQGTYNHTGLMVLTKDSTSADVRYLPIDDINLFGQYHSMSKLFLKGNIGDRNVDYFQFETVSDNQIVGNMSYSQNEAEYFIDGYLLGNGFISFRIYDNEGYIIQRIHGWINDHFEIEGIVIDNYNGVESRVSLYELIEGC